jgi:hypothetical protein
MDWLKWEDQELIRQRINELKGGRIIFFLIVNISIKHLAVPGIHQRQQLSKLRKQNRHQANVSFAKRR